MKKSFRRPYRVKRRKSILENKILWLTILIFIISGSVFYFFTFSKILQVKKIIVNGERNSLVRQVETFVKNETKTRVLFFETNNIFFVNLNKIKSDILTKFPEVAELKIKRNLFDTLNIDIRERKGVLFFYQEDKYFLLDKEGVAFDKIKDNKLNLTVIEKSHFKRVSLGEEVIKKELVSEILKIISEFNTLKIPIKNILIVSDDRINVRTIEDWEVYLNPKTDLDWQLKKLKAVLAEEIPKEKRNNLDYIELRFGDLAPYKVK